MHIKRLTNLIKNIEKRLKRFTAKVLIKLLEKKLLKISTNSRNQKTQEKNYSMMISLDDILSQQKKIFWLPSTRLIND